MPGVLFELAIGAMELSSAEQRRIESDLLDTLR